jgi:hypothetical protein
MSIIVKADAFVDRTLPDCGLQRAIDSLPPNGTLIVPEGVYRLQRSLVLKSDMYLCGAGPETVLTIAPELAWSPLSRDAKVGDAQVPVRDGRCFTRGMEVTVRDRTNNGWNATFAKVTEATAGVIHLDSPLRKNYSPDHEAQIANAFPAITAHEAENVRIRNLRVTGFGARSPLFPFNLFVHAGIHLVRCRNSLIAGCTVEHWHSDGIGVQGGENALVMENFARFNGWHGLHPGTRLKRSVWSGNLSEGNAMYGLFYCLGCREVIASRNRFLRNFSHGVGGLGDEDDQDCLVANNLCERNGGAGVCSGRYGNCQRNFIYDNDIVNNCQAYPGAGILLQCSHENVIARNTIEDTQSLPHEVSTQVVGIEEFADGSSHNYIVANTIRGARESVITHGRGTMVGDSYPEHIPPHRLALLNELLQRDADAWEAWAGGEPGPKL